MFVVTRGVSRRARKATRKIPTCLLRRASLFICCNGNKNLNNFKVPCLKTPSFWRYKENYATRNAPEKFRDFRETGPSSLYWKNKIKMMNSPLQCNQVQDKDREVMLIYILFLCDFASETTMGQENKIIFRIVRFKLEEFVIWYGTNVMRTKRFSFVGWNFGMIE